MSKKFLYSVLYKSDIITISDENLMKFYYILANDLKDIQRILDEQRGDVMSIEKVELISENILY